MLRMTESHTDIASRENQKQAKTEARTYRHCTQEKTQRCETHRKIRRLLGVLASNPNEHLHHSSMGILDTPVMSIHSPLSCGSRGVYKQDGRLDP